MQEENSKREKWYVMRALFRTELKTQAKLAAAGIEVFVPTVERVVDVKGRKRRVIVPVVSNLMFVHSDIATISHLWRRMPDFNTSSLRVANRMSRWWWMMSL